VDGEWCFSPDDETFNDDRGNVNNIIDTRHYLSETKNVIQDITTYILGNVEQDKTKTVEL